MNRVLWFLFGSLGVIALAGIIVALRQPPPASTGPLKLPDGSVVRIVGVTYGTNHLVGRPLARLVAQMPPRAQVLLKRLLGHRAALQCSTTTAEPQLTVWLGRSTNNASALPASSHFTAFLSDASGFISGDSASVYGWWTNPEQMQFLCFPRRDQTITVNFYYHNPTGEVRRCGSLRFANPVYRKFPQWQPEPLPATRQAGDVAVTMKKLSTGHDNSRGQRDLKGGGRAIGFGTNRLDGQNMTVCAAHLRSLRNTNEAWVVTNEEVSDATGNKARNRSVGWGSHEDGYFTFAPGLWTNEAAWKLRCEIKRAQGFAPSETFVFRDVPLGSLDQTDLLGWRTNFNGVAVTLDHVLRRAPNTNSSWSSRDLSQVRFTTAGLTNGVHLDLLSVRTDLGTNLQSGGWSSSGDWREYSFRDIPLEAKTLEFAFAVQTSRWVEFTVKPEVGPLELEYEPQKSK
jgi:hypothetical protein